MPERWLSLTQATHALNTRHGGQASLDQVRRLAVRGAIPAELVGNRVRFDEERLPEIAATIRQLLPAAAASPTAHRACRLSHPAA